MDKDLKEVTPSGVAKLAQIGFETHEGERVLLDLSSDTVKRFEAASAARDISRASLLALALDAFSTVNVEPKRARPICCPFQSVAFDMMFGKTVDRRLGYIRRAAGWDPPVLVAMSLNAHEATEARSRARLMAGTHRVVRLEGNLGVLEFLERVPCWVPRTISDLVGMAMKDFDERIRENLPSMERHNTGYLDVEVPVWQIAWLKQQAEKRSLPESAIVTLALQILYDDLSFKKPDDDDYGPDNRLPLAVPPYPDGFTANCFPARYNWIGKRAAACSVPMSLR